MESFTSSGREPVTSFRTETADGRVTLFVRGELDAPGSAALRVELDDLCRRNPAVVSVDLAGTTFLDSAALAVLVGAQRRLGAHGGRLVIVRAEPSVRRVVQVTGLDQLLPIEP